MLDYNNDYFLAKIDTHGKIPERMKKKPDTKEKPAAEQQSPLKPRGRIMSTFKDRNSYPQQTGEETSTDKQEEDIYGGLDSSLTLIVHGLESDWIEEEMADDDDFK